MNTSLHAILKERRDIWRVLNAAGILVGGALVALNYKSLPFAYTIRLLPSIYKLLRPRMAAPYPLFPAEREHTFNTGMTVKRSDPFRHFVIHDRAVITDLGINFQKSNSSFFTDADISRAHLLTSLFSEALARLGPANFILASVQAKFFAGVKPFRRYIVSTRVLTWGQKGLWLVTYFLEPGTDLNVAQEIEKGPSAVLQDRETRKGVYVILVSKHVFKSRDGTTLPPEQVLQSSGLFPNGESDRTHSEIEEAKRNGLDYVHSCMC